MASPADIEKSYMQKNTDGPILTAQNEAFHQAGADPDGFEGIYGDTTTDVRDMLRLGKKQEFKRNFSFISTLGFISIYMATWEFVLVSVAEGLVNGGFAGLFWTFIGTVTCYSTIVLSLAEMESMAPTSGGQYHWVSEFAPPSCQKFLSYSAGWMSTLGWLAGAASGLFICSTLIQSLIEITNADFVFPNWQYTLMSIAFLVTTIFFNTWGAKSLPSVETASLIGHMLFFVVTIIPLWVMCPKNSAKEVFTSFVDNGGWGNMGTACLVSQVAVLYCNLGSDSACHISEEVEDASWTVPRVMWWSFVLNVAMGIVILLTMLFCIGTLDDAINAEVPYLQLFVNSGSNAVAFVLTILLLILIFSSNITALATTSREVFAFSRDRGFPFSKWLSKIERRRNIPFNAVYATAFWMAVLCLINIGSTTAFNIIISLNLLALLSTYLLSIGCVCLKRIKGEPLPPARWSLGRYGLAINLFAFAYSAFAIVFSCFPSSLPVDTSTANWAPAVWAGVILLSAVTYLLHGRRHFTAPVVFVEGKRTGGLQGSE
ncbi:amino acid transporter-like protein [Exophiala viscosa]|uniref:Amino acid transporter-like protein n=1 Tax=Exophiala viscosa TaxID=2486360 RepID=A0AAN6IH06_9EURO|nr:amino acid transporter-like protein [Exophiala viscosa]